MDDVAPMKLHHIAVVLASCVLIAANPTLAAASPSAAVQTSLISEVEDARASDATDVFFDLCVGTFVPSARKAEVNADLFQVSNLDPELAARLSKGPVRSIEAKASHAMMLISYEPQGLCMVRLASADEVSVARIFAIHVDQLALELKLPAEMQPLQTREIEGMKVTSHSWRLKSEGKSMWLVVTTSPEDKGYVSQHVMTISYVR